MLGVLLQNTQFRIQVLPAKPKLYDFFKIFFRGGGGVEGEKSSHRLQAQCGIPPG